MMMPDGSITKPEAKILTRLGASPGVLAGCTFQVEMLTTAGSSRCTISASPASMERALANDGRAMSALNARANSLYIFPPLDAALGGRVQRSLGLCLEDSARKTRHRQGT